MSLKVFHLDTARDLPKVLAMRQGLPRYVYLREKLTALFGGKRCLMVGSARVLEPVAVAPDDVVICVNGSAHNAEKLGIQQPDATFLVSHIFGRTTRQSRATYDLLRGRQSRNVLIFTGTLSFAQCQAGVASAQLAHDALEEISAFERAAIVGEVCGIELGFGRLEDRVSTGITAAICTLWGGAREVVLTGFSFAPGHSYTPYASRRLHAGPDRQFLSLCGPLRLPVTTPSPALAAQFGITLR